MKREQALRRRMRALHTLSDAVSAMKSLSAHHFLLSRKALPPARAYRAGVDEAIQQIGLAQPASRSASAGIVLVSSDIGLCADYNARQVAHALAAHDRLHGELFYCVGRRSRAALERAGIPISRSYRASSSVTGLTGLLLQIAEDLLEDYTAGRVGSLFAIAARFDGAGRFTPVSTQVLPIERTGTTHLVRPSPYGNPSHLAAAAVREFLYITLYEILLDALAAEHGMRLVAAEAAEHWLDDTSEATRRQLRAIRSEAATQEVLDIAAGARRRIVSQER